jgi:hypothetical protein
MPKNIEHKRIAVATSVTRDRFRKGNALFIFFIHPLAYFTVGLAGKCGNELFIVLCVLDPRFGHLRGEVSGGRSCGRGSFGVAGFEILLKAQYAL